MKFSLWITATILIMISKFMVESSSILKEMFTQRDPSVARTADSQNGILNFVGFVKLHGYPVEEHQVITEDGYVLIFYRIPDSPRLNRTQKNKPIAFLQHGAFGTSEVWVFLGPENGLAFFLADAGFDVWLGALRGSLYGQFHRKYSMSDKEYWQFSYHEHAIYDLPALIDYVLDYTKSKKLNYIGYSMGATMSYILLSTKPCYNEKLQLVVSLAPAAYWVKTSVRPLLKLLFGMVMNFKPVLEAEEIYGIVPESLLVGLSSKLCSDKSILQFLCTTVLFAITGNDPFQLNATTTKTLLERFPEGSFQVGYHYIQNFNAEKFQAYDYGYEENIKRYNQKTPPEYDLKKISAPVAIIYAKNDGFVTIEAVLELYKRLPNVPIIEAVPYKYFTHMDFLVANNIKEVLNNRITNLLKLS